QQKVVEDQEKLQKELGKLIVVEINYPSIQQSGVDDKKATEIMRWFGKYGVPAFTTSSGIKRVIRDDIGKQALSQLIDRIVLTYDHLSTDTKMQFVLQDR